MQWAGRQNYSTPPLHASNGRQAGAPYAGRAYCITCWIVSAIWPALRPRWKK